MGAVAEIITILKHYHCSQDTHGLARQADMKETTGANNCHKQGDSKHGIPAQFIHSVMSDSVTPWTVAWQASLSIINSQSLLKLMSIKSVMPSNHLILCFPLFLLLPIFPSNRLFSNESVLRIRWPKYWSFSFSMSPSNEYSELISLWQKVKKNKRASWWKWKEESEKVGLKLNIQKSKIMASSPITSWQIDGETVETAADLILGGSKITVDSDCSHEIKRRLLLGRKVMTNLDSILKGRDITLSKVRLVKALVFPVVTYGCESWTRKKAECRIIDAFELWCWRRLLRIPWTARRSNQSILKEISPGCSLEAETPIFWPPDVKSWLIWKDPDAGKDWRQVDKGTTEDEMAGWHTDSMDMSLSKLQELLMNRGA